MGMWNNTTTALRDTIENGTPEQVQNIAQNAPEPIANEAKQTLDNNPHNDEVNNAKLEEGLRVYRPRSFYKDNYDPDARNAYEDYVKKGNKYYDPRRESASIFAEDYPNPKSVVYDTLLDDYWDEFDKESLGYDKNTPLPKKLGDNKATYEFLMNSPLMQRYMNYYDDAVDAYIREGHQDKKGHVARFIDFINDTFGDEVEEVIESNPEVAEQVAESVSGENSPIETEAEQLNDSNPNNDEVKDEAIEQTPVEEKQEIVDELFMNLADMDDDAPQIEDQIPTNYGWEKADEPEAIEGNNKTGNEAWDQGVEEQLQSAEDTPEKQEALAEFQEAPEEVTAIDSALSTSDPEEAKEILEETFPELTDDTVEVNLSRKEKAELAVAQALYDNINKAIDEMVSYGNKPKRTKEEKEQAKQELDDMTLRDEMEMNPGNFLPDLYKQLATVEDKSVVSVEDKSPMVVAYEIKDDPEDWRRFIDWNDHVFNIPFLNWKGKSSGAKTFGYDKPQINASDIPGTDNSIELGDNKHTVAGGSTSRTSLGGGSGGGSVSSGSVVSPSTPNNKQRATPGRFGGGHVNLVGSGSNPVASAASSNGGGVTSGKVMRSPDPNMSKGGHLAESRTQLPGGWANNQVPGGNLDISAGEDYQDKEAMTEKGSLLAAKLETILQEDSQTWDGDNSGDKYAPYVFFVGNEGGVQQFYYQKGREKHVIKNVDDATANELINILVSNK